MNNGKSLEAYRAEFSQGRFLAMPLAGMITWLVLAIVCSQLTMVGATWAMYIGTGSILYLGMFISKFTGEDMFSKKEESNPFDRLFFVGTAQALLVFSIAIPFAMVEPGSLPLSLAVLTGLMWMPFSWIIGHWVGYFHTLSRTAAVVFAWFAFPDHRFVAIPLIVVAVYLVTIIILESRYRSRSQAN